MTPIEPHAVTHPEKMHPGAHPALPAHPQEQVAVVPDQHIGVHLETEPPLQFGQNLEEMLPVTVAAENVFPLIAARGHVMPTARKLAT